MNDETSSTWRQPHKGSVRVTVPLSEVRGDDYAKGYGDGYEDGEEYALDLISDEMSAVLDEAIRKAVREYVRNRRDRHDRGDP